MRAQSFALLEYGFRGSGLSKCEWNNCLLALLCGFRAILLPTCLGLGLCGLSSDAAQFLLGDGRYHGCGICDLGNGDVLGDGRITVWACALRKPPPPPSPPPPTTPNTIATTTNPPSAGNTKNMIISAVSSR